MKKHLIPFSFFWVVNSVLLYLAAMFYPMYFVLGTYRLSTFWAALVGGFVWTLLTCAAHPLLKKVNLKLNGRVIMFGFYFLANFIALWVTARLAPYTGFGATSYVWLAGLAIVADVVQYAVWKVAGLKKYS